MDFPTQQQAPVHVAPPARRRTGLLITAAAVVLLLMAATGLGVWWFTRPASTGGSPSAPTTPVVAGIEQPDPSCVTTSGTDHQDMWNANGWWAGRIDGDVKQMNAFNVLSLKLGGHNITSVWICAPRSQG